MAGKPVHKKEPVNIGMMIELCSNFDNSNDLLIIRDFNEATASN